MMKELKFYGLLASVAAMALCGCGDDVAGPGANGTGKISLAVDVNASAKAGGGSRAFADDGVVAPEDLSIKITSADGSFAKSWSSLGDFSQEASFAVGSYTLEAYFGHADDQGFEKPYIYGSAAVKVRDGETTQVGLTATLANSMFTVAYSEGMKQYLQSYSAELQSQGSAEAVAYAAGEMRPAYMPAGMVDVYVSVTKPTGTTARLLAASVEAEARHHYIINCDIKGGAGAEVLTVTFDDALATEDYEIELSDELMNTSAPTITAEGFDPGAPIEMVVGAPYEGSLQYSIMARGKIRQVRLSTSAPELLGDGWPAELELVGLSEADQARYAGMGLSVRGLWHNPDMQALVDLAGLLKNVTLPEGSEAASLQFTLTAIDRLGKASEPATLDVVFEKENVTLDAIEGSPLKLGQTVHKMLLGYNGSDPVANVEMQYLNERGTWQSIPLLTAAEHGSRSAMRNYEVTFEVDETSSYRVRAAVKNGNSMSDEHGVSVERVIPSNFAVAAVNAFATSAYITVLDADDGASYAKYATVYVSTDNATWAVTEGEPTEDCAHCRLKGLQPSTTYYVKATLTGSEDDARSAAEPFTTEDAPQLPNSGMEDWYVSKSGNNWTLQVPAANAATAVWSTLNGKTTSDGGKWNTNIDYVTSSGTIPTTNAVSGKAAQIRTVAWGSGSTNAGALSVVKNIDIGELYLGTYNEASKTPVYGYAFASRPASLQFAARYEAKNSQDYGRAVVKVLDASGAVIAEGSLDIDTSHSSYETMTVPLEYGPSSAKAASLQVCFYSSGHPEGNTKNFINLNSRPKVGGQLFVDDIKLNY